MYQIILMQNGYLTDKRNEILDNAQSNRKVSDPKVAPISYVPQSDNSFCKEF